MAVRRGVDHYRAGAHLPNGTPQRRAEDNDLADPAAGARVPRCRSCGLPESSVDLHRLGGYVTISAVSYRVAYPVCSGCILRSDPYPLADPLDVSRGI